MTANMAPRHDTNVGRERVQGAVNMHRVQPQIAPTFVYAVAARGRVKRGIKPDNYRHQRPGLLWAKK